MSVTCSHSLLFHSFTHTHKHQDVCVVCSGLCVCMWHRGQGTVAPESLGCLLGLSWSGTRNHKFDKLFYWPLGVKMSWQDCDLSFAFFILLIFRQGCCPSSLFSHSGYFYCCLPVERKGMGYDGLLWVIQSLIWLYQSTDLLVLMYAYSL